MRSDARKKLEQHLRAEALRDAADFLDSPNFPRGEGDWLDGCVDAIEYLYERATCEEAR